MLVHQNHGARGENGSIMVVVFVCLCLASKKPSEREFFVPAGTDLGVKLLNCARCVFSIFSLPDLYQIVARSLPDLGDPRARFLFCARFLDFQKNLARVSGYPCQILATISRLPDCARFSESNSYVASTIV
jgi:hypothetical protein